MNRQFKWVVFDNEHLIAAFVFRDDAEQFIEQCGCGSMHKVSVGSSRAPRMTMRAVTRTDVVTRRGERVTGTAKK
jgi:hypothetical protein